jgi:hypothetical protein
VRTKNNCRDTNMLEEKRGTNRSGDISKTRSGCKA